MDTYLGPIHEVVVLGDATVGPTAETLADLRQHYIPNRILLCRAADAAPEGMSPALAPIFEGKASLGEEPTVYVCRNFECRAPISGEVAARAMWDRLAELGHG
jgi:uncharacterized protein YyaL (SSP411 family)